MIRTLDDARQFLDTAALGDKAERVLAFLLPCLMFTPGTAGTDQIGGTRIGGVPDLPPGLDWPVRPVPPDASGIAARGGSNHSGWIARHITVPLPYEFIAQIDLAEAARFPEVGGLPSRGRLLFFYDGAVGPWGDPQSAGRVVYDASPVTALSPSPVPHALATLAAAERAEHEQKLADPMEMAKSFLPAQLAIITGSLTPGTTLEDHFRKIAEGMTFSSRYLHPSQPMRLDRALQWPDHHSLEAAVSPDLAALLEDPAVLSLMDPSRHEWRPVNSRHILMGIPVPEQDDARYDAAFIANPGLQKRLNADREAVMPEVEAMAAEWRLLLQIDQSSLMADRFCEGTIYFVIPSDDLAARDFSRVLTICQQT